MSLEVSNIALNRYRSYSQVFSAPSFLRLLTNNDYGFMDAKIVRYDLGRVGKEFSTYHDYLKYIYKELERRYRTEYLYKNTIINELLIRKYGVKTTTIINEFRVGGSIADLVMFNGTSKVFEIKTELDSNKRLQRQMDDYAKLFNECYIVTHESLTSKYLDEPDHIGIIELVRNNRSLSLNIVRQATTNRNLDPDILIKSLRTTEYKNIVLRHFGRLPEMNSFNMFQICKSLFHTIPPDDLQQLFLSEIKTRKSNTHLLPRITKELRQICLILKTTETTCELLDSKLTKKIIL